MAHFAHVVDNVVRKIHVVNNDVITDSDGVESEILGQQFLASLHGYNPEDLVQCSYNGNIRGGYPGFGWIYDKDLDIFQPSSVFDSEAV